MEQGFWKNLQRPISAIAPMSNVTDEPFRRVFLQYGRPDVFWTEFVSAEGLFSRGKEHCLEVLKFDPQEYPIVAQVFGTTPENFAKTAQMLQELGFAGIDINMGCPDRDIEKKGGGAALMKTPDLAKEIIRAIKSLVPNLPVSVKTRIGYEKNEIATWLPALLEENVAAITIHFRSRRELFRPPAHWELAPEIIKLRDKYAPQTKILGNGDIKSLAQGQQLAQEFGLDGFMVGRGAIGNPWLFTGQEPTPRERMEAILTHSQIFCEFYHKEMSARGGHKNFERMKKHFHGYCKGFVGAKELRDNLMRIKTPDDVKWLVKEFLGERGVS